MEAVVEPLRSVEWDDVDGDVLAHGTAISLTAKSTVANR